MSRRKIEWLLKYSNHLGLFSEDIDFETKEQLGNFPQAYSHLALVNTAILFAEEEKRLGSVVILGELSLVNSLHAYTFASLKRKKLISTTPLNDALNALILALNASAAAFVLLFTKKFKILS